MEKKILPKSLENGFTLKLNDIDVDTIKLLVEVSLYLKKEKTVGYIVGGFIRDTLLGRGIADIDIAVNRDALQLGDGLARRLRGKFVPLDTENKIGRIVFSENLSLYLDLSSFTGTIEDDLARRDFTVNAMAVDIKNFNVQNPALPVIDPFHGDADLDHSLIRAVSGNSLFADPIRLLRAARFAAELGFTIEHQTENLIKQSVDLMSTVAGERVREELLNLLTISRGGQFLQYLDELGLLTAIIPELQLARGVTQPPEHHWDVLTHSLMTVNAVDYILGQGKWDYADDRILTEVPWSDELARYFEQPVAAGSTRRVLLKLAALLHDISKPQTRTVEDSGKMRFLGHGEEGAAVAAAILERLRFSTREINLVANVVKYHLRPNQMGQPPSRRAVYRYLRDVGGAATDVLFISLADHLATRGPALILPNWRLYAEIVRHIMEEWERQTVNVKPVRWVDGNDLMNIFGVKPGPLMGELLEKLKEAQAAGELTNRQAALDYIRNLLLTEGKK